jgi:formate dehydrogenase major subunit
MLVRKSHDTNGKHLGESTSVFRRFGSAVGGKTLDRRSFLKRSGLGVGAGAFASSLPLRD